MGAYLTQALIESPDKTEEMSKTFKEAVRRDILGQYSESIRHYEFVLSKNNNPTVDAYLNLGFIYGEVAIEPPFSFDEGISDKWSLIGQERSPVILQQGLSKYPQNGELHFWMRYFPYRLQTQDFTKEDCEKIIENYGDTESIVPYFFLYLFDKEKYREKREKLLKQCEVLPTAKNRYIKSIIG